MRRTPFSPWPDLEEAGIQTAVSHSGSSEARFQLVSKRPEGIGKPEQSLPAAVELSIAVGQLVTMVAKSDEVFFRVVT
jgi:hypothetical protein